MESKKKVVKSNVTDKIEGLKCFIITPIGSKGSEIQREAMGIVNHVIKPVCDKLNFAKIESAVDFQTGQITTNIIKAIHESDFIVANLTEQNPNVMYELALAHAFRKKVVHIVKEGSNVPFDINVHKYITYINDVTGNHELFVALEKASAAAMEEDESEISNPVIDALKTFKVASEQVSEIDFSNIVNSISELTNKVDSIVVNTRDSITRSRFNSNQGSGQIHTRNVASGLFSQYGPDLEPNKIIDMLDGKYPIISIKSIINEYLNIVEKRKE